MEKDTKTVVVCLIKNKDNKYLLLRLLKYKDHKNEWCPVSGHVKEGETIEKAIVREIKEELNVLGKPLRFISKWNQDIIGEVSEWWEVALGENIRIDVDREEISEYKWFTIEETKNLKLWSATEKFFSKFIWK